MFFFCVFVFCVFVFCFFVLLCFLLLFSHYFSYRPQPSRLFARVKKQFNVSFTSSDQKKDNGERKKEKKITSKEEGVRMDEMELKFSRPSWRQGSVARGGR